MTVSLYKKTVLVLPNSALFCENVLSFYALYPYITLTKSFFLNSFRVVKQKPNSMPRREIGYRLSLWGYAPHAQTDNKLHALWGYAPHTRGYFVLKRKYPKIHQKPAGFWISSGKGALPPLDSPMNTLHKRGSVTACGYCGGNFPQGICKGKPLTHAFADFSRERKVSASVGGMSPQN